MCHLAAASRIDAKSNQGMTAMVDLNSFGTDRTVIARQKR